VIVRASYGLSGEIPSELALVVLVESKIYGADLKLLSLIVEAIPTSTVPENC